MVSAPRRAGLLVALSLPVFLHAVRYGSFEQAAFLTRPGHMKRQSVVRMVVERGLQPKKEEAYAAACKDRGSPAVVLVNPFLDENIGSCARAMMNFGLTDLRLVGPQCDHLTNGARQRSAGADALLESAKVYTTLAAAVADLEGVIATTARQRDMTLRVVTPEEAATMVIGTPEEFAAGERRFGYLFGSERNGLKNEHLTLATAILSIPTFPIFSSLNLGQAVQIVGYEYWKARCKLDDRKYAYQENFVSLAKGTRPATVGEINGMWVRMQQLLDATFENPDDEHRAIIYGRFQNIMMRASMDARDVSSLHGVISAVIRNHDCLEPLRVQNELRDKDGTGRLSRDLELLQDKLPPPVVVSEKE